MKNYMIAFLSVAVIVLGLNVFSNRDMNKTLDNGSDSSLEQSAKDDSSEKANNTKLKDLSNTGLTNVPSSTFDDKSITYLDLSGNSLTGALPGEIRFLSNLDTLDASNNNLTGIPAEIGQLSKIKFINFANNDISGLPNELGNLSNLQTLDLRGNPNVSSYDISVIQPKIPNAQILTD